MPKKKQKKALSEEQDSSPPEKPRRKSRIRGRLHWLLPLLFVALCGVVWVAPILIAQTSLRAYAVRSACSDLQGELEFDSLSLDWFSPVVVRNLTWYGTDGQLLLRARSISSDRSLLDLLAGGADVGTFRVMAPEMRIELRPNGSNFEDALQAVLNRDEQDASATAFALVISDGQIELIDSETGEQQNVTNLSLQLQRSHDPSRSLSLELEADIRDGERLGRAEAQLELSKSTTRDADGVEATIVLPTQVACKLDSVPLGPLGLVLRRFHSGLEIGGRLSCDVQLQNAPDAAESSLTLVGRIACEALLLENPEWFGDDRLVLDRLTAGGEIQLGAGRLSLTEVSVDSSVARMNVAGTTNITDWGGGNRLSDLVALLVDADIQSTGRVDVASLAALLPNTLRVREGMTITSGSLDWEFVGQAAETGRAWKGRIAASELEAHDSGRQLTWRDPIQVSFAGHRSDRAIVIDEFSCRSSFLDAQAQGTLDDARLQARGDLGRLSTELARFFDLGETQMGGRLEGELTCRRHEGEQIDARGAFVVKDLLWSLPGQRPWQEERLDVTLTAQAVAAETSLERIETGTLRVVSGKDRLRAELLEAWDVKSQDAPVPIDLELQGDVAAWSARLQPWLRADAWSLAGQVSLKALARLSKNHIEIDSAKLGIDRLLAQGPGIRVQEPEIRIETSGTWNRVERRLTSKQTTFASRAAALRVAAIDAQLPDDGPPVVSGDVTIRADLDRLGGWIDRGGMPPSRRLTGSLTCQMKFAHAGKASTLAAEIDAKELAFWKRDLNASVQTAAQWQRSFAEPQLVMTARAQLDRGADRLALDRFEIDSRLLKLTSRGGVEELSQQRIIDLAGEIEYDLENITLLLQDLFGENITIAGHDQRQFAIRGPLGVTRAPSDSSTPPLAPVAWSGQLGLSWTSANVSGLPVGPGSLDLLLSQGTGQFQPLDLAVGDGRLRAQPLLNLSGAPVTLALPSGATLDNVELTEQVCEGWLKYVAPVLAQTTRADGRFSLRVDRAEVPLLQMSRGIVGGNLNIHSAQLRPGPLAEQFVWLADQIQRVIDRGAFSLTSNRDQRWVTIDEQHVQFQMQDGRVYHRGLELAIGKVVIRTSGSVGFDQSLALMAEVPIQDEWIEKERYLSSLKGQALQIPVRGTISRPQLDARALGEITGRIGTSAVRGRVQDEIQKQLGRLFNRE